MFGLNGLSKQQRFILGIFVLLIVDIIWVASSELTKVSTIITVNALNKWDRRIKVRPTGFSLGF